MLPRFDVNKGYVSCANVAIHGKSRCDCGATATVLATFRVFPPHGAVQKGKERSGLGVLLLCPGCAVEMMEMDIEAWRNYRNEEATHFMSITEALEMARSKPETPPEEKRVWRSHKWRDILSWMQLQERTVTVAEVAKLWKATTQDIRARLNQFARDGIVERMDKGGTVHYRIKEEACIN